ncbi:hypothetical protein BDA96_07G112400 [Sorghum bicolor]|uniref:Uncharacterized protein n=1 Tax=Sorghum bicolor TaxID=4558 RepID=A0A921QKB6_SORBI|nr:hypothetical protein BDA96_07G112400 [Sorghum bicolor]
MDTCVDQLQSQLFKHRSPNKLNFYQQHHTTADGALTEKNVAEQFYMPLALVVLKDTVKDLHPATMSYIQIINLVVLILPSKFMMME